MRRVVALIPASDIIGHHRKLIDRIEDDDELAWSVIARGKAHLLEGDDARDAEHLRLRPWVASRKFNVVAIHVDEISGRLFHLARPWRHMMPEDDA